MGDINSPDFYWDAAYRSSWGTRDLVHGSDRKLHTRGAAAQRLQCGGHDTAWGFAYTAELGVHYWLDAPSFEYYLFASYHISGNTARNRIAPPGGPPPARPRLPRGLWLRVLGTHRQLSGKCHTSSGLMMFTMMFSGQSTARCTMPPAR